MADDINKKITLDVQVNSDGLQQLNKYSGAVTNLNASISNLSEGLSKAQKDISAINEGAVKVATDGTKQVQQANNTITSFIKSLKTFGETIGKTFSNSFKSIFSNVTGYYKQSSKDMVKSSTDASKQVGDNAKAIQGEVNKNTLNTTQATNNQVVANAKTIQDKILASEITNAQKIEDSTFTIITKGIQRRSDAQVSALEAEKNKELSNASLTAAQKTQITNTFKAKEDQVKLKAFKEQQKLSIAQAIINGAIAITKSEADLGPIAGTIAIAAIAANTAAQIATISAQKAPAMAKGGYFKSDGKGSILPGYSRSDDTNAQLRSGEAVVVSEAMRDPWARNLVSAINVAYGGRDFSVANYSKGYAIGGIFSDGGNANRYYNQPMNDNKNLANTIAYQMINNFPPVYVDVKDINNQQNILAQTVNRVNL